MAIQVYCRFTAEDDNCAHWICPSPSDCDRPFDIGWCHILRSLTFSPVRHPKFCFADLLHSQNVFVRISLVHTWSMTMVCENFSILRKGQKILLSYTRWSTDLTCLYLVVNTENGTLKIALVHYQRFYWGPVCWMIPYDSTMCEAEVQIYIPLMAVWSD